MDARKAQSRAPKQLEEASVVHVGTTSPKRIPKQSRESSSSLVYPPFHTPQKNSSCSREMRRLLDVHDKKGCEQYKWQAGTAETCCAMLYSLFSRSDFLASQPHLLLEK